MIFPCECGCRFLRKESRQWRSLIPEKISDSTVAIYGGAIDLRHAYRRAGYCRECSATVSREKGHDGSERKVDVMRQWSFFREQSGNQSIKSLNSQFVYESFLIPWSRKSATGGLNSSYQLYIRSVHISFSFVYVLRHFQVSPILKKAPDNGRTKLIAV